MPRRFFKVALISLGVVLFTGYFAFSTFLFNPLEGRYPYDVSTLLPRDVDFFAAKSNLSADFDSNLEPRFLARFEATEWGQALLQSPQWTAIETQLLPKGQLESIRAELRRLPIAVDPLAWFAGRDLAISGYATGPDLGSSRWIVLGRANWMGKLAVALLDYPRLLELEKQGLSAKREGRRVTLSGRALARPLHVARLDDVLMLSSEAGLIDSAFAFETKQGQDSLGQSARYHDQIQARDDAEHDELEILARYATLAPKLGLPAGFPRKQSRVAGEAFLGRLFQFDLIRELAGVARFPRGLSLDLSGELVSENLDARQKTIYRGKDLESREVSVELARYAPADSGLFGVLEADLPSVLGMFLDSLEPALVSNFETEIVRPVFGYANLQPLLADLDVAFRDRAILIVRKNDFPADAAQPIPNDGRPTLAWALGLWVENGTKIEELQQKLSNNAGRLRLRGPQNPDGSYGPGIYTNTVAGGLRIYEYWSPFVPGTGHVASMLDSKLFFVANHWLMLNLIASTVYDRERKFPSLASAGAFAGLINTALPAQTFALYAQPKTLGEDVRRILRYNAEDQMSELIDWEVEGPRIRREVLARTQPGKLLEQLSEPERAELEMVAGPELEAFRADFRAKNLPVLLGRFEKQWQAMEAFDSLLFSLRLEPKDFQIALRALLPEE
jgi:hypothetical protein